MRLTRRGRLGLLGVALVVAVGAVGGGVILVTRPATPSTALGAPHFVDDTAASGVAQTFGGGYTATLGGGVAALDCNEDGRPDLFLAGGANASVIERNVSTNGGPLRFAPVDGGVGGLRDVMGAYPIDIDGDGHGDLVVLRVGGADLLRGHGDCTFEPANARWSMASPDNWVSAFSASWETGAGLPTLALGSYVGLDAKGDATYTCPDNLLYRPTAAGTAYGAPIPLSPGECPLSMLFSDWDGSGRRDLRVSNDRHYYDPANGEEQLWRVAPGEAPRLYGSDDGWVQMQIWGMGIASQDVTGDGLPEIYLTSQGDNKLQTLLNGPAQPTYRDIALKRGVIGTRPVNGGDPLASTAWHPEFEDVNNDGFMDLYVSKGNIDQVPDYASRDPSNLFIAQPDGTFSEEAAAAGIVDYAHTRGAVLVDLNADGLLDLVEVKVNAPVRIWRSVGAGTPASPQAMGNWLGVALREPGGNVDAVGALIEVRVGETVIRREVVAGGGHMSGQLGPMHFGLGSASSVDVRVTWPDGEKGPWLRADANRVIRVERGATEVTPLPMPGN